MSGILIVLSQSARIAAVWTRNSTTRNLLLSASVICYTALMMKREKKISRYYDRKNNTDS